MAEQQGIDLATVNGTGPNGRVVKADIEAYEAVTATATFTQFSRLRWIGP